MILTMSGKVCRLVIYLFTIVLILIGYNKSYTIVINVEPAVPLEV